MMCFILNSSASPMLSLERVQGALQLATKLPFFHLDALYTYILSQADNQEALKDILHTQLSNEKIMPSLMEILVVYNQKYTQAMVLSCLANVTPIVGYKDGKLLFHHALFFDYLLDQSRSRDYFVDLAAFFYNVLPMVWKAMMWSLTERVVLMCKLWTSHTCSINLVLSNLFIGLTYLLGGVGQLDKLPPGFMEMLSEPCGYICHGIRPLDTSIFKTMFDLVCRNVWLS